MIAKKLDQLNTREKIGLGIALLLVVFVLADRFAVRVALIQLQRMADEIGLEQTRLENNRAVLAAAAVVDERFNRLRPRLGVAEPSAVAIDRLQGRLDELARQTGMSILAMRHREPDAAAKDDLHMVVVVEIGRFESDMDSLLGFLHALRAAPEVWQVARMTLTPDRTAGRISGAMTISQLRIRE